MRVTIRFEDEATLETSNDLIELANLIEEECDVSVTQEKQKFQQGVKSRLTTRIAIIGLVLTTFQTIIGVAQFWTSENSKYMLKIYSDCLIDSQFRSCFISNISFTNFSNHFTFF